MKAKVNKNPKKKKSITITAPPKSEQQQQRTKNNIIKALQLIDPFLQFLTRATGQTHVPLDTLQKALGNAKGAGGKKKTTTITTDDEEEVNSKKGDDTIIYIPELVKRGVLSSYCKDVNSISSSSISSRNMDDDIGIRKKDDDDDNITTIVDNVNNDHDRHQQHQHQVTMIGFPPPDNHFAAGGGDCASTSVETTANKKEKTVGISITTPPPQLHGSTKTAGKRRLAFLKRSLKLNDKVLLKMNNTNNYTKKKDETKVDCLRKKNDNHDVNDDYEQTNIEILPPPSIRDLKVDKNRTNDEYKEYTLPEQRNRIRKEMTDATHGEDENDDFSKDRKKALDDLKYFFHSNRKEKSSNEDKLLINNHEFKILPKQASYAGTHPSRQLTYGYLSEKNQRRIPNSIRDALGLQLSLSGKDEAKSLAYTLNVQPISTTHEIGCNNTTSSKSKGCNRRRRLYQHQVQAIESALNGIHTIVCTGTGSGKSLCFLLPILTEVMLSDMNEQQEVLGKVNEQQQYHQDYDDNINIGEKYEDDDESVAGFGDVAIIMFPTKALAQDQLSKLTSIIKSNPLLECHIRPGVIDGDTSHTDRSAMSKYCNIILTNPDTLHAAILPGWKNGHYRRLLARVTYVVVDELHVYEGAFGAHVSLVLSRLVRLCCISYYYWLHRRKRRGQHRIINNKMEHIMEDDGVEHTLNNSSFTENHINDNNYSSWKSPLFIGCSATIGHPEDHFRLLCPIPAKDQVCILSAEEDTSPRAAKHFFCWNPPLLDMNGNDTGQINILPPSRNDKLKNQQRKNNNSSYATATGLNNKNKKIEGNEFMNDIGMMELAEYHNAQVSTSTCLNNVVSISKKRNRFGKVIRQSSAPNGSGGIDNGGTFIRRRHAADETAQLVVEAMKSNLRCIAFCKTRMLVEWVYERCVAKLKSDPSSAHLTSQVESYRGGYSADVRRNIENRLFRNKLLGVIGTSALELGVDIGGIDLTLHCGYPGSLSSLLQQSGRAGRGGNIDTPSFSIMVCFSSPSEQQIWKHPKGLLIRGLCAPPSVPLNSGIVNGHMMCAGKEHPLCGSYPTSILLNLNSPCDGIKYSISGTKSLLSDHDLFGSKYIYEESLEKLLDQGLVRREKVNITNLLAFQKLTTVTVFTTHPTIDKPYSRVSMRSIEPISYSIVDTSNPIQDGKTDAIHDTSAIMDTIPYSRVFYHAFPGAIIMHRGRRYRIHTMTSPPPLIDCSVGYRYYGNNLGCYATPTTAQYSTQALSTTLITVVKELERVQIVVNSKTSPFTNKDDIIPRPKIDADHAAVETRKSPIKDSQMLVLTDGTIAGNGVVNVKRTVHGYKKLSLVNRVELSRTEISLPPMEYDTNALWIDTEASNLNEVIMDYDAGVHALSHALVAVAPLFVPCTMSDLDCDHSHYSCTRVLLFDVRAGGAGTTSQLWQHFFHPKGILESAIDLLEDCPSGCCNIGGIYKGGCPGCLQSVPCVNFHQDLNRTSALHIARRMLVRIKQSELYQRNFEKIAINKSDSSTLSTLNTKSNVTDVNKIYEDMAKLTPQRRVREKALRYASDLVSARKRNILVGRPSWPMDDNAGLLQGSLQMERIIHDTECSGIDGSSGEIKNSGGFITPQCIISPPYEKS